MRTLETIRPFVEIMAAERCQGRPDLFDDAVQEGLIAAWRVAEAKPEASDQYINQCARRAIGNVLRGRPMTGGQSRRGWSDAADSAIGIYDADGNVTVDPAATEGGFEQVETHLDSESVRAAVAALPDEERALVVLRYWEGLSVAEAAEAMGISKRKAEDVWRRAKDLLKGSLA